MYFSSYFISRYRKNVMFLRKRNVICPDDTRRIIFQCDYFGKTIFSKHLKKISYFYVFFEKDHLSFSAERIRSYFPGKKISSFLMIQEGSYASIICFGKTIFSEHLEKENMVFSVVYITKRMKMFYLILCIDLQTVI